MKAKLILFSIMTMILLLAGCAPTEPVAAERVVVDAATEDSEPIMGAPVAALADNAEYTLDSAESALTYGAFKVTGKGHTGTVVVSEGMLERADGEFSSGLFTIDMTTITDDGGSEGYLNHVMNEDFFDVENHPTSMITVTSITHMDSGNYEVTGDLTILGNTNTITFPAIITATEDGARALAEFTIDRTLWDITYGSGSVFADLGDRAIKDEIEFTLDLLFVQA